jgi:hypothetical protein
LGTQAAQVLEMKVVLDTRDLDRKMRARQSVNVPDGGTGGRPSAPAPREKAAPTVNISGVSLEPMVNAMREGFRLLGNPSNVAGMFNALAGLTGMASARFRRGMGGGSSSSVSAAIQRAIGPGTSAAGPLSQTFMARVAKTPGQFGYLANQQGMHAGISQMVASQIGNATGTATIGAGSRQFSRGNPTGSALAGQLAGIGGMAAGAAPAVLGTLAVGATAAAAAIVGLGAAAVSATQGLSEYGAATFRAATNWEFAMMGIQIKLANAVGPTLEKITYAMIDLIEAASNVTARLINEFGPALVKGIEFLTSLLPQAPEPEQFDYGQNVGVMGGFTGSNQAYEDWAKQPVTQNEIDLLSKHAAEVAKNTGVMADKMINDGRQYSTALMTSFSGWAHGGTQGFGQLNPAVFANTPDAPADLLKRDRAALDPAHARFAAAANGDVGGANVIPRPDHGALNMNMADHVTIETTDYERIHSELSAWTDRVLSQLSQGSTNQLLRIMSSRLAGRQVEFH